MQRPNAVNMVPSRKLSWGGGVCLDYTHALVDLRVGVGSSFGL